MTTAKAERSCSPGRRRRPPSCSASTWRSEVPAWADGQDAEGCAVVLVGAHHLRTLPDGEEAVRLVLEALGRGEWPDAVHVLPYKPVASAFIAASVADPVRANTVAVQRCRRSDGARLAKLSMRLPTRRRVTICTTHPGDPQCWPYEVWLEGGGRPGTVAVQIPATDRLTPEGAGGAAGVRPRRPGSRGPPGARRVVAPRKSTLAHYGYGRRETP